MTSITAYARCPDRHIAKKAAFIAKRATRPFAKEGAGSCYNVACAQNIDIALWKLGHITGVEFLSRLVWKVGHTNNVRRRRRDYAGCDAGQTHIWVCRWEINRRYYCGNPVTFFYSFVYSNVPERLTQLEELCNGGEPVVQICPGCGIRHREYLAFLSVGGFTNFTALMTGVITFMGEVPTCVFFNPVPDTLDIYNLILQS
ncbi:hypothetical protein B0H11DRAFT_1946012 [Mycena galericulata]|nr:hypothetical protein B0H11DRAFT_1946012 [Mycena galericulata]